MVLPDYSTLTTDNISSAFIQLDNAAHLMMPYTSK
jgi:hypothetical protein